MARMAVTASPATRLYSNNSVSGGGGGARNSNFTPSDLNEFRISAVIDRLSIHLYSNATDDAEFENLCHSLSRGIDFSIANNEVPNRSQELPSLVKMVCQTKNDTLQQPPIMVLMISVKSACQNGWFPNRDSEELVNLSNKIASAFCSAADFNAEPHPSHLVISTVMPRFYPRLKMGHIFVSLEVKPGFDAYVSDFQISKNLKVFPGDRIRLFVVQTDSLETSSCLVTPAKVNFLLNGKGVERRTNLFTDTGPQIPTVVTPLLKYGSNLLQAVGEFNGNYIIIVAFMSEVPNPDISTLQNCEQHAPATVDADSEVIEGSSRISLNCPISFKRIKTPVKGVSCKHIQCFDFDNYVDINSRRPSWRCPHCNQYVCFSDIRIDQKMVEVLKEVGPKVSDIIVSLDGSWNAVMECEDTTEKSDGKTLNTGEDESPQSAAILDLTQTDDPMDVNYAHEIEDIKHSSEANAQTAAINTNNVNQSSTNNGSDFWTEVYMSTFEAGPINAQPNVQASGPSASTSLLTESTSTNREVGTFHHDAVAATSPPQIDTSLPNTLQFPQYQLGNPPVISDYGRLSSAHRHITRTPSAVQSPYSLPQQSPTHGMSPAASQASPTAPNSVTNCASPHHVPLVSSSSPSLQHSSVQQNQPFPSARPSQQNAGFRDPNQVPNMYRSSHTYQSSNQLVNLRIPRSTSQSPRAIPSSLQSSASLLRPQGHTVSQDRYGGRTGVAGGQQSHLVANANRAVHLSVGATRTVPSYPWNPDRHNMPTPLGDQRGSSGSAPSPQPVTRTDADGSANMDWRPAIRMRGALSGQAYDEAFNLYITQPNQQVHATRPLSNTTLPNNGLPNLPEFIAGGTVHGTPHPSSVSAGSEVLPNASSRML